jgi:hypothetical protein
VAEETEGAESSAASVAGLLQASRRANHLRPFAQQELIFLNHLQ